MKCLIPSISPEQCKGVRFDVATELPRVVPMRLEQFLAALLLVSGVTGCVSTDVPRPTPPAPSCFREMCPAPPSVERYYLLLFTSQHTFKVPRYTHTWATVVRVTEPGPNRPFQMATHTISWLPASLRIRSWDLGVETGLNLDLRRTLEDIRAQGMRVSLWGPYEIDPAMYCHFLAQQAFLESGRVGYQGLDVVGEAAIARNGMNCVHAVAGSDARCGNPVWRIGDASGEYISEHLIEYGAVINADCSHDWLITALGLSDYPVVRCKGR